MLCLRHNTMFGHRKMNFTAIDFETANSSRGSACAVGLGTVEGGRIVRAVQHLIRPDPLYFSPFNISIHGITAEDVANAPSFAELWSELLASISEPLVAHNASFDISVIRRSLDNAGMDYPDIDYYCTRVSDVPIDFYKYVHRRGISLIGAHTSTQAQHESSPGH